MDVHQDITNDPAILNMTPQRFLIKSVIKLFAVGVAGSSMVAGEVARPLPLTCTTWISVIKYFRLPLNNSNFLQDFHNPFTQVLFFYSAIFTLFAANKGTQPLQIGNTPLFHRYPSFDFLVFNIFSASSINSLTSGLTYFL